MNNFIGSRPLPNMAYHNAGNIKEVGSLLQELEYSKVIAGCTDFIPAIKRGAWVFEDGLNIVDIKGVRELRGLVHQKDIVTIGSVTTLSDIEQSPVIKEFVPILGDAIREMASWQIRNTATIGGNLCTASPAADTAPPLLALDASVKVFGPERETVLPLNQFFVGPGKTVLQGNEILTEIRVPAMKSDEKAYSIKLGRRNAFTLSIVSVAVWMRMRAGFLMPYG